MHCFVEVLRRKNSRLFLEREQAQARVPTIHPHFCFTCWDKWVTSFESEKQLVDILNA